MTRPRWAPCSPACASRWRPTCSARATSGKTIGIKLRYDTFKSVTRDQTLDIYTADAHTIRQTAGQCLKRVDLTRRLRLLGVRVGSLVKAGEIPIFEQKVPESPVDRTASAINFMSDTPQLF